VLNIVVIGGLIWDVSPGTKQILWTYQANNMGEAVALGTTIIATIWAIALLVCTKTKKNIPHTVRIVGDVFTSILYLAGSITLGVFMRQDFLWDPSFGNCNAVDWTIQQCKQFWFALIGVELAALFFGVLTSILTIVDIIMTVKVKHRQARIKEEPRTGGYFAY